MLKLLAIIGVLMHGIRNIEFHLALPSLVHYASQLLFGGYLSAPPL